MLQGGQIFGYQCGIVNEGIPRPISVERKIYQPWLPFSLMKKGAHFAQSLIVPSEGF